MVQKISSKGDKWQNSVHVVVECPLSEEILTGIKSFLGTLSYSYESGINTLISRELSEGQWHQVLTFISDIGIYINLELDLFNLYLMI